MVEFKRHSGLKVGESRLMLVRKVSSGVCEYAQAEAGCNGPMAVARELRRVTPDRCMEAAVRVAELCQEAADALERTIPTEGEAKDNADTLREIAVGLDNRRKVALILAAEYIERTAQGVTVTDETVERYAQSFYGSMAKRLSEEERLNIRAALTAALKPEVSK
jgi:hypothetical protein